MIYLGFSVVYFQEQFYDLLNSFFSLVLCGFFFHFDSEHYSLVLLGKFIFTKFYMRKL